MLVRLQQSSKIVHGENVPLYTLVSGSGRSLMADERPGNVRVPVMG